MKKILIIILVFVVILSLVGIAYWKYGGVISSRPSVTLTYPNGGETLKEGSIYTIKWDAQNIPATDKISINIRRVPPSLLPQEGQEFDPIVFINLENTGSKDWTVSDMYPDGNYILGITGYASLPITDPITDESNGIFHIIKPTSTNWQTYINAKFGYQLDYPSDWTYREFPDTQTGAGFRPQSSSNDVASECVTVDERGTAENEYSAPFDEYVKIAAISEIQGYEKLNSIKPVITAGGLTGYETTWVYKNTIGQEKISLPITYFDNAKIVQVNNGQLKYKTTQIILDNADCEEIYNRMISTFKIE